MKQRFSVVLIGFLTLCASVLAEESCCQAGSNDAFVFDELLSQVKAMDKATTELALNQRTTAEEGVRFMAWSKERDRNADQLADTMSCHFLQHRIQAANPHYADLLRAAHAVMVDAAKIKASVDIQQVQILKEDLEIFQKLYQTYPEVE